jgi:hypothetical protein
MKRFTRKPKRVEGAGRYWCLALIAGALAVAAGPAQASPIHKHVKETEESAHIAAMASAGAYRTWSEYLTGGPSVWSTVIHPPVTPSVESAIWKAIRTDPGESSPWVQFMLYKQSLDPARFAFFHPKVSVALDRLSKATTTRAQFVSPPATMPSGSTTSPTEGQSITSIPEPATWLLAMGLTWWGVWRFRRPRTGADERE